MLTVNTIQTARRILRILPMSSTRRVGRVLDQSGTFNHMVTCDIKTQLIAEAYVEILQAAVAGWCLRVARKGVIDHLAIAEVAWRIGCCVGFH